jgi:hypothetical protein
VNARGADIARTLARHARHLPGRRRPHRPVQLRPHRPREPPGLALEALVRPLPDGTNAVLCRRRTGRAHLVRARAAVIEAAPPDSRAPPAERVRPVGAGGSTPSRRRTPLAQGTGVDVRATLRVDASAVAPERDQPIGHPSVADLHGPPSRLSSTSRVVRARTVTTVEIHRRAACRPQSRPR